MTISKNGDVVSLNMREFELDSLYNAIGNSKPLAGLCKVIEEYHVTYGG